MAKIYLIDSENVGDSWIQLLPSMQDEDKLFVFYTDKSPYISYESLLQVIAYGSIPSFIKCHEGRNALDFQLVTELGYKMAQMPKGEFVIVSDDNGFDAVIRYWSDRQFQIRRIGRKFCRSIPTQRKWGWNNERGREVAPALETPADTAADTMQEEPLPVVYEAYRGTQTQDRIQQESIPQEESQQDDIILLESGSSDDGKPEWDEAEAVSGYEAEEREESDADAADLAGDTGDGVMGAAAGDAANGATSSSAGNAANGATSSSAGNAADGATGSSAGNTADGATDAKVDAASMNTADANAAGIAQDVADTAENAAASASSVAGDTASESVTNANVNATDANMSAASVNAVDADAVGAAQSATDTAENAAAPASGVTDSASDSSALSGKQEVPGELQAAEIPPTGDSQVQAPAAKKPAARRNTQPRKTAGNKRTAAAKTAEPPKESVPEAPVETKDAAPVSLRELIDDIVLDCKSPQPEKDAKCVYELFYSLSMATLTEVNTALKILIGNEAGNSIYRELKEHQEYRQALDALYLPAQRDRFLHYVGIVLERSDLQDVTAEEMGKFLLRIPRKNLNSIRSSMQKEFGHDQGSKVYTVYKPHIKVLNKI